MWGVSGKIEKKKGAELTERKKKEVPNLREKKESAPLWRKKSKYLVVEEKKVGEKISARHLMVRPLITIFFRGNVLVTHFQ